MLRCPTDGRELHLPDLTPYPHPQFSTETIFRPLLGPCDRRQPTSLPAATTHHPIAFPSRPPSAGSMHTLLQFTFNKNTVRHPSRLPDSDPPLLCGHSLAASISTSLLFPSLCPPRRLFHKQLSSTPRSFSPSLRRWMGFARRMTQAFPEAHKTLSEEIRTPTDASARLH